MTDIINHVKTLGEALRNMERYCAPQDDIQLAHWKAARNAYYLVPALLSDLEKLLAPPSEEELHQAAGSVCVAIGGVQSNRIDFFYSAAKAAITTFLKGRGYE